MYFKYLLRKVYSLQIPLGTNYSVPILLKKDRKKERSTHVHACIHAYFVSDSGMTNLE